MGREGSASIYDLLNLPDGEDVPLKVRSMVGLIPLFAVETLEPELLDKVPDFARGWNGFWTTVLTWPNWCRDGTTGTGRAAAAIAAAGHRMKELLRRHAGSGRVSFRPWRSGGVARVTWNIPTCSGSRTSAKLSTMSPAESRLAVVRRQFQLARPSLVSGELPYHRIAPEVSPLLRRRLQDRMPHRLGPICDNRPGCAANAPIDYAKIFLKDE